AARASQSSYHGGFFRGFRRQHKTASVCTHFACLSETQRQSDVTSLLRWARGRYSAPGPGFEPGLTDPEVPHREQQTHTLEFCGLTHRPLAQLAYLSGCRTPGRCVAWYLLAARSHTLRIRTRVARPANQTRAAKLSLARTARSRPTDSTLTDSTTPRRSMRAPSHRIRRIPRAWPSTMWRASSNPSINQ